MVNIKKVADYTTGHKIDYNIDKISKKIKKYIKSKHFNKIVSHLNSNKQKDYNLVQHLFLIAPPNITAQSLPPPFITTEILYINTIDMLKRQSDS